MPKKPTYNELELKVKILEAKLKAVEQNLKHQIAYRNDVSTDYTNYTTENQTTNKNWDKYDDIIKRPERTLDVNTILDAVNLEKVQRFNQSFCQIYKVVATIFDLKGNMLIEPGYFSSTCKFVHKTKKQFLYCKKCVETLQKPLENNTNLTHNQCKTCGTNSVVIPLLIDSKYIANWVVATCHISKSDVAQLSQSIKGNHSPVEKPQIALQELCEQASPDFQTTVKSLNLFISELSYLLGAKIKFDKELEQRSYLERSYRSILKKSKVHSEQIKQNNIEIKLHNEEIKLLNEELRAQNEELLVLNEELEQKNAEIDAINNNLKEKERKLQKSNEELRKRNKDIERKNISLLITEKEIRKQNEKISRQNEKYKDLYKKLSEQNKRNIDLFEELKKSESRLQRAQMLANIGNWERYPDSAEMKWSVQMFRNFGYEPHSFTPDLSVTTSHIEPADLNRLQRVIDLAISTKQSYSINYKYFTKDGEERYALEIGEVETDSNDKVIRLFGTHQNITATKRIELALRESENKFRSIVDNSLQGLLIIQNNRIVYFNQALTELTGYSDEKIIAFSIRHIFTIIYPEDRQKAIELIKIQLNSNKPKEEIEFRILKNNGQVIWLQIFPVYISYLGKRAIQIAIIDITAQKAAQKALKESEKKYRLIFENIPVGILHYDPNGVATACNDAHSKIIGATKQQAIGLNMPEKLTNEKMKHCIRESLTGKRALYRGKYTSYTGQKSTMIRAEFSPVLSSDNKVIGGIAIVLDITEQIEAEKKEQLAKMYQELRADMWQLAADKSITNEPELAQNLFELVAYRLKPSRIGLSKIDNHGYLQHTLEWVSEDQKPATRQYALPKPVWTAFKDMRYGHFTAKQMVDILDKTPELRQHKPLLQSIIDDRNIKNILLFPYDVGNSFEGFMFFEWNRNEEKKWTQGEIYTGMDMSKIISINFTRLRAEKTLKESEEKYRTLIENSRDGICIIRKHKIRFINSKATELWGHTPDMVLGQPFFQYIATEKKQKLYSILRKKDLNEQRSVEFETVIVSAQKQKIPVEISISAIQYQNRSAFLVFIHDLRRRRIVEEERTRLATVVEQITESIVITDKKGNIQYVNPAFEKNSGYLFDEIRGKSAELQRSGVHKQTFYDNMWKTIESGMTWSGNITNKRKDGSLYDEHMVISPIKTPDGEIVNYVAIKRDVTEELKMEKQLKQSQKLQAIGTLAGGIAHDFNNILMGMQIYTELSMIDLPEKSTRLTNLKKVINAQNRAKQLIEQILTFSRQTEEKFEPLLVHIIVKEALNMLRSTLPSTLRIVKNINNCGYIRGIPSHIHQIVMNLCTNANQAMNGNGTFYVDLELVPPENVKKTSENVNKRDVDAWVLLKVTDTGVGMDKSTQERIFEPFFTTKEVGKGTGLGLSTVHGIVKRYKGVIHIESEIGKGSSFYVYLPKQKKQVNEQNIKQTN